MTAIAFAIAALGFAASTALLAIRLGGCKSALTTASDDRDQYLRALATLQAETEDERRRLLELIGERNAELRRLYEELDTCGSDSARGRAAVLAIGRMLSPTNGASGDG